MRFGFKEFRKSPHSDSTEFRKRYPADISAKTGKQHFTVSVGQITEKHASAAFAKAFSKYEERCTELRQVEGATIGLASFRQPISPSAAAFPLPVINPTLAEEAIERWRISETIRAYEEIANGQVSLNPLGAEAIERSERCVMLDQYRSDLKVPEQYRSHARIPDFDDRMLAALAGQGYIIPDNHPVLRMLRTSFADAWLSVERYRDRMIRDPASVEPPSSLTRQPVTGQTSISSLASQSPTTLQELAEKWLDKNKKPAKTRSKLNRCVAMLSAHLGGNVPVESITPLQLIEFYENAVKLPARPRQHERDMTFAELVNQDIPARRCLTIQTIGNWFNILHSACNWGRKTRLIGFNPITDHKPDTSKAKQKYPTRVPTDAEISKFFTSSIYTERAKSPAWFWLPLLSMYTGARLNELGQLERSDVVWDETPYLHITTDTSEDEDHNSSSQQEKSVKNNNSKRKVPIHPRLLELGFREFWHSSNAIHLFSDLPHEELREGQTPTQDFSRNFGRYLRRLEVPRGVKFHSFRHLFTDVAEDMGVHPKVRSVLVGHGKENDLKLVLAAQMTDTYGSGYGRKSRLMFMHSEIKKVEYASLPPIKPWQKIRIHQ
ncbi:site-specific integrase [Microvirga calopogonii]|uniref:site-specific integrase n=1 Tax=Microvirga calopogonii TaxID=2078013 RepID=UPI000E0CD0D9|nr:site-specific integrase [Microvirga calopogonii]